MAIVLKIVILIAGLIFGIGLMKYSFQLTQLFGHNDLAERTLGSGGTYSMWKLLGVAVIIGVIIYVF